MEKIYPNELRFRIFAKNYSHNTALLNSFIYFLDESILICFMHRCNVIHLIIDIPYGEPLCGFILDTPIYAGLSLKADLHWNFCPSPYSWLLMPYTCLFFFSSPFYFLFPCSLSQNFNHFISRYLKPLKGQQRLDKNDNQTCTTGSWSDGVKCAALVKEI